VPATQTTEIEWLADGRVRFVTRERTVRGVMLGEETARVYLPLFVAPVLTFSTIVLLIIGARELRAALAASHYGDAAIVILLGLLISLIAAWSWGSALWGSEEVIVDESGIVTSSWIGCRRLLTLTRHKWSRINDVYPNAFGVAGSIGYSTSPINRQLIATGLSPEMEARTMECIARLRSSSARHADRADGRGEVD
jgi:hypothetical protein